MGVGDCKGCYKRLLDVDIVTMLETMMGVMKFVDIEI